MNVEAFTEMIEYTVELSQKYGLAEEIEASGYYSTVDESLVGMDIYETMRYFEANSTPEFYGFMSSIVVDGKIIGDNEIINNDNLLPNEQMALIVLNNMMMDNYLITQARGNDGVSTMGWKPDAGFCRRLYNGLMGECDTQLLKNTFLTIFVGCLSGGMASTVAGAATALDYANCQGEATNSYMYCMELI